MRDCTRHCRPAPTSPCPSRANCRHASSSATRPAAAVHPARCRHPARRSTRAPRAAPRSRCASSSRQRLTPAPSGRAGASLTGVCATRRQVLRREGKEGPGRADLGRNREAGGPREGSREAACGTAGMQEGGAPCSTCQWGLPVSLPQASNTSCHAMAAYGCTWTDAPSPNDDQPPQSVPVWQVGAGLQLSCPHRKPPDPAPPSPHPPHNPSADVSCSSARGLPVCRQP